MCVGECVRVRESGVSGFFGQYGHDGQVLTTSTCYLEHSELRLGSWGLCCVSPLLALVGWVGTPTHSARRPLSPTKARFQVGKGRVLIVKYLRFSFSCRSPLSPFPFPPGCRSVAALSPFTVLSPAYLGSGSTSVCFPRLVGHGHDMAQVGPQPSSRGSATRSHKQY